MHAVRECFVWIPKPFSLLYILNTELTKLPQHCQEKLQGKNCPETKDNDCGKASVGLYFCRHSLAAHDADTAAAATTTNTTSATT